MPIGCTLVEGGDKGGAGDGDRTRYLNLGKVALCQMSYSRVICPTLKLIGLGFHHAFRLRSHLGDHRPHQGCVFLDQGFRARRLQG